MWWAFGYPIAFGDGNKSIRSFIGGSNFFMAGIETSEDPKFYAHWIFQWAFAATSATIVSGAAAERCRYQAYVIYTLVITGFVYPVVVHWVWSDDGWLSASKADRTFERSLGLLDFAGSSVVHVTGGGAAFFAAWFLGPRIGRFEANGRPTEVRSNDQSLIMLGSFILWFGWYAFNSSSGVCVKDCMVTASLAAVNTTLSAAAGSMTVLFIHFIQGHRIQIAPGLNGLLAGLVGITAGCAVVEPFAAVLIGIASGGLYYAFAIFLLRMRVDDPLEASAVHFAPGLIGTIAVGLFATETNVARAYTGFKEGKPPSNEHHLTNPFISFEGQTDYGLFYGGDGRQLSIQILGTLVIAFWTCSINFALFGLLDYYGKLRVCEVEEMHGLNASIHGIPDKHRPAGNAAYALSVNGDPDEIEKEHMTTQD